MVEVFTPVQAEKVRKMHRIRNCKVQYVFKFYEANNQLYANVVRNDSALQGSYTDGTVDQYFVEHVDGPDNICNVVMERKQENIRGQTEAWRVREEIDEAIVLERRIGLFDDAKPILVRELPFSGKESLEKKRDCEHNMLVFHPLRRCFDLVDSRLPTKSELREASLRNASATARLFMRNIGASIRYAVDINPKTKMKFQGLFGNAKAYFGMVESQGGGTLHIHFLIWLNKCPSNSAAIDRILNSSNSNVFRQCVAAFAKRIVTNNTPIPVDQIRCSACGADFASLNGLPIPAKARRYPQSSIHGMRARLAVTEPVLIQCGVQQRRTLGHEVMNGFQLRDDGDFSVITTSKFYLEARISLIESTTAVKNVTNQQKQLDSQVAVAVAAFKRRQDREALEASAKPLEATNGV
ncbi:Helitron helicase-like domain [Phytophthora cactorum]|nr:Helitron helicase-like domain [Phytophthora cactorum]